MLRRLDRFWSRLWPGSQQYCLSSYWPDTTVRPAGRNDAEAVVGANGEAAAGTFDQEVRVAQDFTTNADAISTAFRGLKPADNGSGRMIDAVNTALDWLAGRPGPRRANILVIGETRDRGSKEKLTDLIPKMQRAGATVYSLSYSAYLTPFTTRPEDYQPNGGGLFITEIARLAKENTVKTFTEITGGRRFGFETKSKLENNLIHLGSETRLRRMGKRRRASIGCKWKSTASRTRSFGRVRDIGRVQTGLKSLAPASPHCTNIPICASCAFSAT